MSIFLTAFGGMHNSSYQIIKDCENDKLFFTNSYDGIDRDIERFDLSPYSAVVMFGLDSRLKNKIRIEPKAALNGYVCKSVFDVGDFVECFEMNSLQVTVSKQTTSYLCNYAYYCVLEITGGRALLVHIPPERYLTEDMRLGLQNAIRSISSSL